MIISENSRRCSNCYRYPFCNKCNKPTGKCDEWKSKCEKTMALESKEGYNFTFTKIGGDS